MVEDCNPHRQFRCLRKPSLSGQPDAPSAAARQRRRRHGPSALATREPLLLGKGMLARRILAIAGGGIRGLITCIWLGGVADARGSAEKSGLVEHLDLLAGTSTGAIVACGLGAGLKPAVMAELYREHRQEIFPGLAECLWSRAGRLIDIAWQLVGDACFRLQTELRIGMDDLDDTSQTHIVALEKLVNDCLQSDSTRQMLDPLAKAI